VSGNPDCGAVVILTDSWYQTFQNVMLLVIGALFAALVALVGHGAREFRLFTVE
jgi:hypothetical protein